MVESHRPTPEFTFNQRKFNVIEARTTRAFGKVAGIKTKLDCFAFNLIGDFLWNFAGPLNEVFVRVDFIFNKAANGVRNHRMFVSEAVNCHGVCLKLEKNIDEILC
jgi:hypothetical protein